MNFHQFLTEKIMKSGENWIVTNKSGKKVLGTHSSKKKAMKQLAAVEISKKLRGKK